MRLSCNACGQAFRLDVARLRSAVTQGRCSRCQALIPIPVGEEETGPAGARIVSVSNRKGGVAKTSTCLNLGFSLAHLGRRVLMMDLDSQANLTILMGYRNTASLYDLLSRGGFLPEGILETRYPGLSLFPGGVTLERFDREAFGNDFLLKNALERVAGSYDYILLDTPPAMGFSTLNALTAAHLVLIPSPCDYLATHGICQVLEMIGGIRSHANPRLDYRILLTLYEAESLLCRTIRSRFDVLYRGKTAAMVIDLDEKLRESQIVNTPVFSYAKTSRSALQYLGLAREIISMN